MKAACMRFRSKLAGLFSGSHTYSTTQMQDWRVRKRTERAYGHSRVLASSMFLFHVVEREVYLRKVSKKYLGVLHDTSQLFAHHRSGQGGRDQRSAGAQL